MTVEAQAKPLSNPSARPEPQGEPSASALTERPDKRPASWLKKNQVARKIFLAIPIHAAKRASVQLFGSFHSGCYRRIQFVSQPSPDSP
jgi:hypothetical protein